jgi:hypothetical protein
MEDYILILRQIGPNEYEIKDLDQYYKELENKSWVGKKEV